MPALPAVGEDDAGLVYAGDEEKVVFLRDHAACRALAWPAGASPFWWSVPNRSDPRRASRARCDARETRGRTDQPRRQAGRRTGLRACDPREKVIAVAYYGLVSLCGLTLRTGSDAADAAWRDIDALFKLVCDHPLRRQEPKKEI